MKLSRALLREPMVHFVAAGLVLYGAFALLRGSASDAVEESTIVVNRPTLLAFMQYRANAFDAQVFNAALDAMSDQELEGVIDEFVREEVLYREARTLGLEDSDYIIRQRMIQKMSFLMSDVADTLTAGDDADLAAWFAANVEAYAIAPWTTFTHIFFDSERRGAAAVTDAEALREELNTSGAGFNDAPGYGDRFPFLNNYVERTYDFVAGHFGSEFAAALADLPASETHWQGPLRSAFGQHLVMVIKQAPRALPSLDQVRADVERDFATERSREAVRKLTESIRERYRIEIRDIRSGNP